MEIYPPELDHLGDKVFITSRFICQGKENKLWFKFDKEFSKYAVLENSDAFLVALLPLAMQARESIKLHHPLSEGIYYNVTEYLIPLVHRCIPDAHEVEVIPSGFRGASASSSQRVVATGLSCGIDSFFTIAEHSRPSMPEGRRITHCVFTDTGSHGESGSEVEKKLFEGRLENSRKCATELGLKIVLIESNLSELLPWDYMMTHNLRNPAAVLALEKLFSIFYYSAGGSFEDLSDPDGELPNYDPIVLSYLSTDGLRFVSSGFQFKRTEKTEIVSSYEPSYRYLNVCTKEATNCSVCNKCLRTELTLDLLGKIELYGRVFDLEKYRKEKVRYLGKVKATERSDFFSRDILELMRNKGKRMGFASNYYALSYRMKSGLREGRSGTMERLSERKRDFVAMAKSSGAYRTSRTVRKVVALMERPFP